MATAQDYDIVPYEDCPLVQTRPDYLGIIAKLMGLNAAPPDQCRVLELGCAGGGNIIPLACYWPQSQFLGIELSEKQAMFGNQLIEELQLPNIKILNKNILELDESLGTFDYVIAHGVYSWVPVEVQRYLLTLISKVLAPQGIAFVSYNTLPGWYFRQGLRDMMAYHSGKDNSTENRRDRGMEMLRMLAKGLPENNSLSEKWIKRESEKLLTMSPSYLLHDYMEENNRPVYFYQFMEQAQKNQLQFLCEADMYTMLGSTLTETAEAELDKIDNLIDYQQYLDFYYVRFFRQTLLCRDTIEVEHELDIDILRQLFFTGYLTCAEDIDLHATQPQAFTQPNGDSFDISHPLTKAAIVALSYRYPNSFSYAELLESAIQLLKENGSAYAETDPDELLLEAFNLFVSQGLELTQVNRSFDVKVSEFPKTSKLAEV